MPLYMDIHKKLAGATSADVAMAHEKDIETGPKYGVKYTKYWYDQATGTVFCLIEAPNKEAAERVHREAHGLVADEIHQVIEN